MEQYSIFHIEGGLGKHVAATAIASCIKNNYPNMELILVNSVKEGLELVSKNEVYAFVDIQPVLFYNIAKYGFCIDDVDSEDAIEIYDLTQSSLGNTLDKVYDGVNRRLVFVSKSLISHSSIYFKFKYNGK